MKGKQLWVVLAFLFSKKENHLKYTGSHKKTNEGDNRKQARN